MSGPVRLIIDADALAVDAPRGRLTAVGAAAIGRVLDPVRPELVRACTPPLPPRDEWPELWREVHAERLAIACEGGASDPEAVANADLRVTILPGAVDAFHA